MEAWIPITIAAALAQTGRFMVQKHLATGTLSASGATLARFLYAAPLVVLAITVYGLSQGHTIPPLSAAFWIYAMVGGGAQILATICVVAIFAHRNFAVGITFKKTEVILTAIVGFVILGDVISPLGALAVAVGFLGVIWLSDPPGAARPGIVRFFNRAAGLGLLSGVFFAFGAVGYRGAVLEVQVADTAFRAGLTLAFVTVAQTLALGAWLWVREPGEIGAVLRSWRVSSVVGVLSMIGSFCWFAAFSLQNAAYVFALGQIELIFSILAATLWFREAITRREAVGMAVLTLSIVLLVAAT